MFEATVLSGIASLCVGVFAAAQDAGGPITVAASPGVYWSPAGAFWLSVRAQLPFYSNLFGNQSVGPTVVVGFLYQLL